MSEDFKKKSVIIICSRVESKRVPRKAFQLINGITAIEHILARVKNSGLKTVVAVPDGQCHEYEKASDLGAIVWEGNAESPLHRMADFLKAYKNFEYVVRITHDDILIDQREMMELLEVCFEGKVGYGFSQGIIEGAGVEVISRGNILSAAEKQKEPVEHISYFVKGNYAENNLVYIHSPRESIKRNYRLTMDYPEDVIVLEAVFRGVGQSAGVDEVCAHLDRFPEILDYNKMPEVTIYSCARNAEKWVRGTMATVLTMKSNMEYIVIDDASTDSTLNQILAISAIANNRVKVVVNSENLGLASSCNKALSIARGRYIMRVDADDLIPSVSIQKMIQVIKMSGAAAVYANFSEIDGEGKVVKKNVDARISHHAGCALMDTRLLNEIRFTEGLKHWDGLELYNRMKRRFPIEYIEEPLWYYRKHPESMSVNNVEERAKIKRKIQNADNSK